MLDRLKLAETINKIIICTSTNPQDNPLEEITVQENVHCFRGSEDDVLKRLLDAAREHHLPFFANITADCPLIDPALVDQAVLEHVKSNTDLTMYDTLDNDLPFDCYVIQTNALEKVVQEKTENDTEVWLKYFQSDTSININAIEPSVEYYHSVLKTSIDYPEDYEFMKRIFSELYDSNNYFSMLDIISLVKKKPQLLNINTNPALHRRWHDHIKSVNL